MPPKIAEKFKSCLLNNLLTILMVSGVVLGTIIGVLLQTYGHLSTRDSAYISALGDIMMRLLKFVALPLIISCIILAMSSLDLAVSKSAGWQLLVAVIVTKVNSTCIGVLCSTLIHPGSGEVLKKAAASDWTEKRTVGVDTYLDMFRQFFPPNIVGMLIQTHQTLLEGPEDADPTDLEVVPAFADATNMLGVVVASILVGLFLGLLRPSSDAFLGVLGEVYEIVMRMTTWVLWASPGLLMLLIMGEITKVESLAGMGASVGWLILCMWLAFAINLLIAFPLEYFLFTWQNPFRFYANIGKAMLTAFASSSSLATLPVAIECLVKHGLDERIVNFVMPVATNISKDGAAAYFGLSVLFVAQCYGTRLGAAGYLSTIMLGATGSMATSGVPLSGPIVLVMILSGLNIRQELVGVILAVDWINDRGSTLTNVTGNCLIVALINKWNAGKLKNLGEGQAT